jgi:hypothetical protein
LPDVFAVQDSVELPDAPAIDVEDRVQTRLVEFVVTARVTAALNPLRGATVIVEVPAVPVETETVVGFAERLKSGVGLLKNSVIGVALVSPDARLARFQFTSIVLVKE